MKTYKRSNTGKGTTWTDPRVLMNHRVLDECVNADLCSDMFIASDVGRICSFWSHVTEIKTHLPILNAEDIYTWDWYWLHITGMLKLNPSCGSYTEGAAGDTGIHTQLLDCRKRLKREFQGPTEDAGLSTTFLSYCWSSLLLTAWEGAQEKRQVWLGLRSAGAASVAPWNINTTSSMLSSRTHFRNNSLQGIPFLTV